MRKIEGNARTIRELMKSVKYSIDYYQREYKWGKKQVTELVDDLISKFMEGYGEGHDRKKVADYPHYFLGSIIVSEKGGANYIVDGQQRLTSLSLFMIFLHNLRRVHEDIEDIANVDELIFSEKYGEKSFNLDVKERRNCIESLFNGNPYETVDEPESVQNIYNRYQDIDDAFPDDMRGTALPYFIDWMMENVHLVEITAYTDEDAYTIFETMNDRGLSLSPTDMLKGFLLSYIQEKDRADVNQSWKQRIRDLSDWGKEVDADFFKAWFRSQYATKIRERKRGALQEDFDFIGTEYHRWVRNARKQIGLENASQVLNFIQDDFEFYSSQYLRLLAASKTVMSGLEHVRYNACNGFTQQYMLLLAPLKPDDTPDAIDKKISITAQYIDILLTWRLWNFRKISYSTMQYAMFIVMRDIRGKSVDELARLLHGKLLSEEENFDKNSDYHRPGVGLYVHQQNRKVLHQILARMTDFVEVKSDMASHYEEYVDGGKVSYEVEHVWANHFHRHKEEFTHLEDFNEQRNRIGGLLLLPQLFNRSYGDKTYAVKLVHYFSQNMLARSLHPKCYEHNPGFMRLKESKCLPFQPITNSKKNDVTKAKFNKADLDQRGELYRQIAKCVWNPDSLLERSRNTMTNVGHHD